MTAIVREEIIKSDRPGAGPYVVGLTADGDAVSCTCVHGRSGRKGKCYHRKRAERAQGFREQRAALLRSGAFGGSKEAFDKRFLELAAEAGVDEAIRLVLEAAVPQPEARCTRCGGSGQFLLRSGKHGECFRCKGTGKAPSEPKVLS